MKPPSAIHYIDIKYTYSITASVYSNSWEPNHGNKYISLLPVYQVKILLSDGELCCRYLD